MDGSEPAWLDRIWAGWRQAYVTGASELPPGDGTLFERLLTSGLPDDETYIIWRGETCFAVLNLYPYTSGHLLVVPMRPVEDLADLADDESAELWQAVELGVTAIRRAYDPDGVNVGLNLGRAAGAGIPGHLHVHCLPRWAGDTNFTTTVAATRVMPEPLDESWQRLRESWPDTGRR